MKNLIENFKEYEEKLNKSDKTIQIYVKEVKAFINDYNINSIEDLKVMEDKEFWNNWLTTMISKYKPNTIEKKKTALSVFSSYLVYQDIISINKIQQLGKIQNGEKKIEVYSEEEINQIFNYMENKIKENNFQREIYRDVYFINMVAIKLMYKNALRVSEAISIELNDFNLSKGNKFYIRGKGGHGKITRFNSFSDDMVDLINECLKIRSNIDIKEGNEKYLFISPITKAKITDTGIRKFLNNILKKLNIETTSPCHNLRHYRATELINKGTDVKSVSMFLGHSSEKVTEDYYIHSTEDTMNELVNL